MRVVRKLRVFNEHSYRENQNQYLKILSVIKYRMLFGLLFLCNYFLLLLTKSFLEIKLITVLYITVI